MSPTWHAMKAQIESRGMAPPIHKLDARMFWLVSATNQPLYVWQRHTARTEQKTGWPSWPVGTGTENIATTGIRPGSSSQELCLRVHEQVVYKFLILVWRSISALSVERDKRRSVIWTVSASSATLRSGQYVACAQRAEQPCRTCCLMTRCFWQTLPPTVPVEQCYITHWNNKNSILSLTFAWICLMLEQSDLPPLYFCQNFFWTCSVEWRKDKTPF